MSLREQNYWLTTVTMPTTDTARALPETADVVVIGGGFTGLSAARTLAKKGANAVVLGRSDDVGKPQALLLMHANATVTICHSKTRNLQETVRRADIIVAAIGRTAMVTREWVKEGAVVIDVGTNKVSDRRDVQRLFGNDETRLKDFERRGYIWVGDVDERSVKEVASMITPVPGGVGPMTIATLMKNTIKAARMRRGL